jgi:hypothetical protein
MSRVMTLELVGSIALDWQKAVSAVKVARIDYLVKFREHAGGERISVHHAGWNDVMAATEAEYKAWQAAKGAERNALRRLERATRRCEQ